MVRIEDLRPFRLDYAQLDPIAYFFWMSEYVLTQFTSNEYTVRLLPDIPGYGPHWGGVMAEVCDNEGAFRIVCHIGLIYHPLTRTGIYLEAENASNRGNYQKLWRDVQSSDGYDLNKEESEYIKLFFPDDKLDALMSAGNIDTQMAMLTSYYDACFKGLLNAAAK